MSGGRLAGMMHYLHNLQGKLQIMRNVVRSYMLAWNVASYICSLADHLSSPIGERKRTHFVGTPMLPNRFREQCLLHRTANGIF
jgi:hypothetical protein